MMSVQQELFLFQGQSGFRVFELLRGSSARLLPFFSASCRTTQVVQQHDA